MKITSFLGALALACLFAVPAFAQNYPTQVQGSDGAYHSTTPIVCINPTTRLPESCPTDPNNAAFQGEVPMTVGTTYQAGRSLKVIATVAGNVSVTYADGSTGVWAVVVGVQTLPIAITAVNTSGTTATATYSNLK